MVLKSEIEKSFLEQNENIFSKELIYRKNVTSFTDDHTHIEIISGVRRCGKSTLMKQIMQQTKEKYIFFNFEDSRIFGFEVEDFSKLDEIIGDEVQVYFFDEIQNIEAWEIYIRRLHDRGKKIYITGSNASLLSKELGTRLTGRYLRHEIFPFNYSEYLDLKKLNKDIETVESYVSDGGFPEFLQSGNIEFLQNLLKDILLRDIAIRYGIRNTNTLFDVALFLLSNVGKSFTFNSLKNNFGIGSANTVSDYLGWMEDSYLFFYLQKFSYSAKQSMSNPRKVYAIDNGLVMSNSLSFTEDKGRLLENLVFLELRKRFSSIFYFNENKECDFVVFEKKKCRYLIQSCEEVHLDNKDREISGLLEAMKFFKHKKGFIITKNQSDYFKIDGYEILLVPLAEYLEENFWE